MYNDIGSVRHPLIDEDKCHDESSLVQDTHGFVPYHRYFYLALYHKIAVAILSES